MGNEIFECRKCGHCCEGKGGIVLGPRDQRRLAARLGLAIEEMAEKYCEISRGKMVLGTGPDGYCVFFELGKGCAVHSAKPDICRAWPFFRGNLEDAASFVMARNFCPGISRKASHNQFAREGKEYLQSNGLLANNPEKEANSLCLR